MPDIRQVRRDHGKLLRQQWNDRPPHSRSFRKAVQQNHRWSAARGQIMQFNVVDPRRARIDLRFRVGRGKANQSCNQTKDLTHEDESYILAPTSESFLLATALMR